MLKFSASYLKKHKARFLITTVYSFLLILLIFVIIYSAFSVVATARRDVEEYAHQSGNEGESFESDSLFRIGRGLSSFYYAGRD